MRFFKLLETFIKTRYFRKFKSRKSLEEYQKRRLREQNTYLLEHAPFFRGKKSIYEVSMDKAFMMEHFNELNTLGVDREEALALAIESERSRDFTPTLNGVSVGLSSGTSGHRGIFLTSGDEQSVWAGSMLAKMLPKNRLFFHRLAFFLRADNVLYKTVHSVFLQIRYFDMTIPIKEHVGLLNAYRPTILTGPPSVLALLAAEQERGNLRIAPLRIISGAEILEERDRDYIAAAFGLSVIHQVYQATEGFLGYTCEHGTLHLNEDMVHFEKEYIDEKRFVPIIRDFTRTSQAFINYRLNDILVEADAPCPCGLAFCSLKKIEGRCDDIFLFRNQSGEEISVFPDFIRRVMLFVPGLREYQVFQRDEARLEVAVPGITQKDKEAILREFAALFAAYDIPNDSVSIEFINYRETGIRKLKRISRDSREMKGTV